MSETITDIVREMREVARVSGNGYCAQCCEEYAERIRAANKREIVSLRALVARAKEVKE